MRTSLLAVLWAFAFAPAWAQDEAPPPDTPTIPVEPAPTPAPPPKPASTGSALEDIVVTAERHVSTVQETPISIEAFNSEKLSLRGINGLGDLSANVPSMTIEPFPTHNSTLRLFIRGVGVSDAQVTQDPAVGVYIDGVYVARSVGLALDIADLERIEVLRGPQGTLYGRNTTGGAINLITKKPDPGLFSMTHSLTFGAWGLGFAKSSFNIPLADDLAVKVAVLGSTRNGFQENTGPGGDFGDKREGAARLGARWLGEWLTADYTFDYTRSRYYNYMFQAQIPSNTNHGLAEDFKPYAQSQTVYSVHRLDALATAFPLDPCGSRILGHALTLAVPFGDYEIKYVGAFRRIADDEYTDLSGGNGLPGYRLDTETYDGPAADMANGGPTPAVTPQVFQHQWSHELQFSGKLFEDTLSFVAGAFAFDEKGGEHGSPLHHILNATADPQMLAPLEDSVPGLHDLLVNTAYPGIVGFWDYELGIHNTAQALFGQFTWSPEFLDRKGHLTFGVRQSWDDRSAVKDYVQQIWIEGRAAGQGTTAVLLPQQAQQGNDIFVDVHAHNQFSNFSPSANLQYDLSREATVYLSSASAYKSGGFNVRDPQISGASGAASDGTNFGFGFVEGFKPEHVHSLETGVKSEWLHRKLRINADVFASRYRDMQTNFLVSGTIADTKSRNVGRARMRGLELDTALAVGGGLVLSVDYAYLDAKVLEVLDINGNNVANLFPFISAPRHSGVAAVDWTFLERGWGALRGYVSYHYVGHRNGLVIVEERRGLTSIDGYGLLDTRFILGGVHAGAHGSLDVALWGKNLLDKEYPLTAIDNLPQADRAVIWGQPRSAGLDFIYRYD